MKYALKFELQCRKMKTSTNWLSDDKTAVDLRGTNLALLIVRNNIDWFVHNLNVEIDGHR